MPSARNRSLWPATFAVLRCGDLAPQYCLSTCIGVAGISCQCSAGLELRHGAWIGRVLIHINDTRHRVAFVPQSPMKEALGSYGITPVSQQEVDSLSGGIDSSVQKSLSSLDVDVRLVQAPSSICPSKVRSAALVDLWTKHLNPTPNAARRNRKPTLVRHFSHVHQRKWISQVPPHAPQNNVTLIVPPFKWIRGRDGQH
jgi:hypothetical protein